MAHAPSPLPQSQAPLNSICGFPVQPLPSPSRDARNSDSADPLYPFLNNVVPLSICWS